MSTSFLENFIGAPENPYLSVMVFNQRHSETAHFSSISKLNKNISFFCCGSRINIVKKIKFIILLLFISIFKKPTLIISTHINLLNFYIFVYPLFKIKYTLIMHGIEIWNPNLLKKIILKNAKFLCSNSEYTASRVKSQVPLNNRIFILSPPVDEKKFFPDNKDSDLLGIYGLLDKKVILTVCRLDAKEQYKGYDRVIEALPLVLAKLPQLKYLIIGKGDDVPRIERLIKIMNLENNVIICGSVCGEELNKFYNLCDVFIMPSKREGFGIVFIEALACGKPVIAGNKDGSREALLDGELGILVDPDNTDEIAEAIIRILRKEVPERILDGEYLRRKVIQEYGSDRFKERIGKVLELINS